MISKYESRISRRLSLPLTAGDEDELSKLRSSFLLREMLMEISGISMSAESSDAHLVHSLVQAGLKKLANEIEERGYAQLAADLGENE